MEDWRYINSQRDIEEFVKETMVRPLGCMP
ncbi:hypothetical protein IMSAGC009_01233 [Lachnospiraceae bacterium]|nr:hypothetical protein IMSAGC009_01233 [Lachnospiraceae bacterium]